MDLQALMSQIMQKSELSGEEVAHNIRMKMQEFGGLIDEISAAKLIAREFGIHFSEEREETRYRKMAEIVHEKIPEASTVARVMNINSPRDFEAQGRRGRVCNVEIADNSGRATLVLWDEDVRWLEAGKVARDDALLIANAQPKSYNPLELHSTLLTELTAIKPEEFASSRHYTPLPQQPVRIASVGSLKEGEIVDIFARVQQVSQLREFSRSGKAGKILDVLVADAEGKQVTLVLWDYYAEHMSHALGPGAALKIEGGIVKKGSAGLELHLNWASHLILGPHGRGLEEEEEMLLSTLQQRRMLDLKAGERGIVKAHVAKIASAELSKDALVVEAELRDEIAVPVRFAGDEALKVLQLRALPRVPLALLLKLKEEYIKGKRITAVVRKEKDRTGKISKFYCERILNMT